ncbi:MoaD/ThiS family protein [Lachnoclostridium sp. An169]|uniref:MoaD/ThiS family protein n=1 Tax=Lachnoclostridium sp. An169 TaxID=1965569 RepID=UPI0013A63E65|nr:MoaD/ThiS family protein [Lachnoclostridium sp. An169]HJA68314.1 MoaD/ThiS family protein [Candidatus Mediterraneibacter cottocaccae]
MVTVKIFGVARLRAGTGTFRCDENEVKNIDGLLNRIPNTTRKEAKDLVVLVNGNPAGRHRSLKDGDEVALLAPAGGG